MLTKYDIKNAVREVLEEQGLVSPLITREEVIRQTSRHRYDKAVKNGYLTRIKAEGKHASVRINRSEFIDLLNSGKI